MRKTTVVLDEGLLQSAMVESIGARSKKEAIEPVSKHW